MQTQPRTYHSTNIRLIKHSNIGKILTVGEKITVGKKYQIQYLNFGPFFHIWSSSVCQFETLKQTLILERYLFFDVILFVLRLSQSESGLLAPEARPLPGNEEDVKWQELRSSKLNYLDEMLQSIT